MGTVVCTTICMKCQRFFRMAILICHLKGAFDKLSAIGLADSVADNHAGKQIENRAYVIIFVVEPKVGDITYPNFIWTGDSKLLVQIILKTPLFFVI